MTIDLRTCAREDIPKMVIRLLRSGICFNFASDYADLIESGQWLEMETWESVEHNEKCREI